MKTNIITIILCFIAIPCFSQCPINKPKWADDGVIGLKNSVVQPFYATGHSLEEAREKVEEQKRAERARLVAQRVEVSNSGTNYSSEFDYSAGRLDEHHEICGQQYHYWQMAQIVINTGSNPIPEKVDFTDRYRFSPRVFVPGMAQIHKGSTGKGIAFIAGEVLCVGGIVVAESMRASYETKLNTTHDKAFYADKISTWENVRNGAIAGAVAVYAWNVIDGIVAKGKKHLLIGDASVKVMPYATTQVGGGVSLAINF